jgi:hypothetical protein
MATATAMTKGNGNDNGDGNGDGNGDCNGNGLSNGNNDIVVTATDTKEGCFFMCQQCVVLWQG